MTFNGTVPVDVNNGATVNVSLSSITYTAGGFAFNGKDGSVINMGNNILQGTGAFTLNAGATLECANTGGLNVTLSNTGAQNLFADANYIYDGTAPQVTGTILPSSIKGLVINNASGVTLSSPTTVNGTLSTLSGDLTLNSNILTLGSLGMLNETAGNTVLGKVVTSRVVAQAVNNTFGGVGIEINAVAVAPGTTDVERVTGIAQNGNGKTSILRYFKIAPAVNSGLNATFIFKFDNSELAGQDANVLKLFSSQDDGVYWIVQGGTSNASERKITLTGVNNFSSWTAADTNNNIGSGTTFAVSNGWNMISVPVTAPDYRKIKLFPDAQTNAFAFQAGYVAKDTLKNGIGYWLKFSGDHNVSIPGIPRSSDSVDVSVGWNMIGSVSSLLSITNVVPSSGVNIVSPFYQYQNGYATATTLYPGKAYWVKVSASGKLYLGAPGH